MIQFIDHTADVRMKVCASSIPQLFSESLIGLSTYCAPGQCTDTTTLDRSFTFDLQAPDQETLLIDFLSEALSFMQIHFVVFCKVTFHTLTENYLQATLYGKTVDEFQEEVKSITYHEGTIIFDGTHYCTTIVFDI